jgi:hypothetical protein
MIRRAMQLFCEEEHGFGDVAFPENPTFEMTAVQLRRAARAAGWSRNQNADYCDICTTANEEHEREQKEEQKAGKQ